MNTIYNHLIVDLYTPNIAVIRFNRPEVLNALNREVVGELTSAVKTLSSREEIRCIILTGDDRSFVAGADIKEMVGASVSEAYNFATEMKALHQMMICSPKPIIAAINGYCLGGGLELALAADIRLASPCSQFGFPEINLGIVPGGGGICRLSEITGISTASKMILTGELITAQRAMKLNIVSEIHEEVFNKSIEAATLIASKSNKAVVTAKRLLNSRNLQENNAALQQEVYEFSILFDHPDSVEGMHAYLEKRKPKFQS